MSDLNEYGIAMQGTGIYDWSEEVHSHDSTSGFGRYSFDVGLSANGEKTWKLKGSDALIRLRHHLNNFGNDEAGEMQLVSNIDAGSRTTLYEAWIEQRLFSEKVRFKFGKIDANSEFAAVQTASDFLNSSMGYSPTIVAFPSYPEPKMGFNAFMRAPENISLGLGLFRTATGGALTLVEPGRSWSLGPDEVPGHASVGYWRMTGSCYRFDGVACAETHGFYSVTEQVLWRHSPADQAERRVSAFLQLGVADGRVSSVERHVGSGFVIQGISARRIHDSIGVASTWVRFSSMPQSGFDFRGEVVLEGYYKASITKHVAFVQDFQFLHHPGGLQSHADCSVVTPRIVVSF